jgi:hypothetical protein
VADLGNSQRTLYKATYVPTKAVASDSTRTAAKQPSTAAILQSLASAIPCNRGVGSTKYQDRTNTPENKQEHMTRTRSPLR